MKKKNEIGRLEAGVSQFAVARNFNVAQGAILHLWTRFQHHGSTNDPIRADTSRATSAAQNNFILLR